MVLSITLPEKAVSHNHIGTALKSILSLDIANEIQLWILLHFALFFHYTSCQGTVPFLFSSIIYIGPTPQKLSSPHSILYNYIERVPGTKTIFAGTRDSAIQNYLKQSYSLSS